MYSHLLEKGSRWSQLTSVKNFSVVGLLVLNVAAFIYAGSLQVIKNKEVVLVDGVGGESTVSLVEMPTVWMLLAGGRYFGGFLISLLFFVFGYFNITVYDHFRKIFIISGVILMVCPLCVVSTNNYFILFFLEVFLGVTVSLLSKGACSYYVEKFGDKVGTRLLSVFLLFSSIGMFLEGQIRLFLEVDMQYVIFYVTTAIAIFGFITILLTVEKDKTKEEKDEKEITDKNTLQAEDKQVNFFISVYVLLSMLAPLTGYSSITVEQDVVFNDKDRDLFVYPKTFFNLSSLIGTSLCFLISLFIPPSSFGLSTLVISLCASLSLIPLALGRVHAAWWSAGFFAIFYEAGMRPILFVLVLKTLKNYRNISLAMGLGSTLGWVVSSLVMLFYRRTYHIVGDSLYYMGIVSCLIFGSVTWLSLRYHRILNSEEEENSTQLA